MLVLKENVITQLQLFFKNDSIVIKSPTKVDVPLNKKTETYDH